MIKINYKGTSCRATLFIYRCTTCQQEHEDSHPAEQEPTIQCDNAACDGICIKKPTAPALDADFHESVKTSNLGWS